ncbi:MAG: amino acid ABC transporter permease [Candidatus Nanopelagicales bacterium]
MTHSSNDNKHSNESWYPSELELQRQKVRSQQSRKRIAIATSSSVLVLGGLVLFITSSPGWELFKQTYFDIEYGIEVLPIVARGITTNIRLTVIASILITILALLLALARTSKAAALTPFRILATVYVDIFRGVPLLLVILLVGFGVPALGIRGLTGNVLVLGTLAVVLTYSAYVAEVFRSGILSIHPSQRAAARSLGLTQAQAMRYVILPQAIRRVIPPLLNDLVALIKDTGLVSILGVIDAVRAAQIQTSKTFNYTPYIVAAILFLMITIPLTRITDRALQKSIAQQNSQGTT